MENLKSIIENHKLWLLGQGGKRANLEEANLEEANLEGANLEGANLEGANLEEADLEGAYLRGADLRGANLEGVYLRGANLEEADLEGAYLRGADLEEADLEGACLWSAIGNKKEIKSLQLETYDICYTKDVLQIGCQRHNINDWWGFDDEIIEKMDYYALNWWKKWKPILKQIIEMSPAK